MFSASCVHDLRISVLVCATGIITGMDPGASDVHCIVVQDASEVGNVSLVVNKLSVKFKMRSSFNK